MNWIIGVCRTSAFRVCNFHLFSGHSIEAGWFLLDLAIKKNKPELVQTAIQTFMITPFNYGWDKEHGGIYYFLDVDGWSPVQLEWDLKLFWPHNEAMISFLMAYKHTKDTKHLDTFSKIFDYCYSHVSIVNKHITHLVCRARVCNNSLIFLIFYSKQAIFQPYHDENKLLLRQWWRLLYTILTCLLGVDFNSARLTKTSL